MRTYDPATDVGRVRLLIADTDLESALFEDEELEALLALAGDLHGAAAMALEAVAADRARLARRVKVGGYEAEQQAVQELRSLAERHRSLSSAGAATASTIGPSSEHLEAWRP